ncbi:MAG TPA: SurA N-terminal domain-containing protein [Thiobacillaceae bacterium]|nr:SurA N-terminal domain-containing protein [Thiobacillaceae bacterium]
MLEAIRDRAQGWIAKLILALITVPFALWGIESYFNRGGSGDVVAEVGKAKVYRQEFNQALQNRVDSLRQSQGANYDPAITQSKEFRESVLNSLVDRKALLLTAADAKLVAPDQQVAAIIQQIPLFLEDGQFSRERYESALRQRGLTPIGFENEIRQEILLRALQSPLVNGVVVPSATADRLAHLVSQQREVSWADIAAAQFAAQVQVSESDLEAYYNARKADFTDPEAARVEYVILSKEALASAVQPSDQDIQNYYQANQAKFGEPEQRAASHILIAAGKGDTTARQKAKAKAESLLVEIRKNPASFAELAKRESQDPGSAAHGGSLGSFPRGVMVKPFDDAVFSMKVGELRGPVETDYGYHIIRLDGITPAKVAPLASVRDSIVAELRSQQGQKLFAKAAENFSNLVYDQSTTLKPAADAYKLPIQTSDWITRKGGPAPLDEAKLLDAIFSSDSVKNKQNTEAIETAKGALVAARVIEYRPATLHPLASVGSTIRAKLIAEKSAQLAEQQGVAELEKLNRGEEPRLAWSSFQMISRQQPGPFDAQSLADIFRVNAVKLPAYTGVKRPDGSYRLVRISRVSEPSAVDPAMRTALEGGLRQALARADTEAYLALAKAQNKVEVKASILETKE